MVGPPRVWMFHLGSPHCSLRVFTSGGEEVEETRHGALLFLQDVNPLVLENPSYGRFTIEQIAGDLLPNAGLGQMVATGFNRCLATTGEGGAIAEEYDAIYAQDRTNTTAAVWLGLTAGCAACHDHKFDPISTKDTYSFNAFFRNTTMFAMDRNKEDHPPNIFVPHLDDQPRWEKIDGEITVDTGHVVGWDPSLEFTVTGMGGLKQTLFSGEGLVLKFRGSGKIYLQTRTLSETASWLSPFCKG